MSNATLKRPLKGIIPPLLTPMLDRSTLDADGLGRLVERVVDGGVHGLFILGTTGEAPSLDSELKRELIKKTCECVAGRVPVLVGISETAFTESLKIAELAKKHGADALVLAPPYYFPAGQPELLEYLEHLAPMLPLPLFLYNMPFAAKPVFEPETVRKAMDIPGVVGIKDSSASMLYFHRVRTLLADKPEASFLTGPEELLAETVLMGGHGGVCGGANLFPKLYVELYKAASSGDLQRTRELQDKVLELGRLVYGVGRFASSGIKGLKTALSCLGVCSDFMADPFHKFRKEERDRIERAVKELEGKMP